VDQVPPGESEGIDEPRIHNKASKVGDLGCGNISRQGEEKIESAQDYSCLSSVQIEPGQEPVDFISATLLGPEQFVHLSRMRKIRL
jgi:hypothetical protein